MWTHFKVNVNNCQKRQQVSHRLCQYTHHDGEYIGGPENIHMPSFDSAGLARELIKIENNPDEEAKGHKLTNRMKWVQEQLSRRGLLHYDSDDMRVMDFRAFKTIVPFIDDFSKPAICYVADTSQFKKGSEVCSERPSSVVMALALAEQLKRTDKYRNVIILFINQHSILNAACKIKEMAERGIFQVRIGDFVVLDNFFGDQVYMEEEYSTTAGKTLQGLLNHAGIQIEAYDYDFESLATFLSNEEYSAIKVGSMIDREEYDRLDKLEQESIVGAEQQIKTCSTQLYKATYRVLWQHALTMSAMYYQWGMNTDYKH